MPLILMTGLPCSSKSTRTQELVAFFRAQESLSIRSIHVVNDESLKVDKAVAYADPREEKKARGALIAAVERLLHKEDLVIVDAMNYIKGFRYQLYCVTRSLMTPHCLIHCATPVETAREWNARCFEKNRQPDVLQQGGSDIDNDNNMSNHANREKSAAVDRALQNSSEFPPREYQAYSPQLFEELASRYEVPDPRNRWDSPLFTVIPSDPLPLAAIVEALFERKALPPKVSTIPTPVLETNFLHELDQTTLMIVNELIQAQKDAVIGDTVFLRAMTLSELRRHRTQFISLNKAHPIHDTSRIAALFADYLVLQMKN